MVPHLIFGDQHSPIGHTIRMNHIMMCTVIMIIRDDAYCGTEHSHEEDDGVHPYTSRLLICYGQR